MERILFLPGDWQDPGAVEAFMHAVSGATDQVEVDTADIGFSAYEKYGEYLPYETLDLLGQYQVVVCGPVEWTGDPSKDPAGLLISQMDLFARTRRFITLADDLGVPDVDITVWGSNVNGIADVSETRDVDGITISKYVRSAYYSRMMGVALTDLELSRKTRAACLAREDLFPESSRMFYESFDALFCEDGVESSHSNILNWLTDVVRNPAEYEYLIVADLYLMIAESTVSGLTGRNDISPTRYVGDGKSLIMSGSAVDTGPVSAILSAASALSEIGLRNESENVLDALKDSVSEGNRSPDLGGEMTTAAFADSVTSRLRRRTIIIIP